MYSRAAAAAARAVEGELGRALDGISFCANLGEPMGVCMAFPVSLMGELLSSPSLGRRDSVEPLFLRERAGLGSTKRANSIWRKAI